MPSSDRNQDTIRKLLDEIINTGRLHLCDRYLSAARVDHQDYGMPPGAADGHNGFRTVLGGFCAAFSDLHLSPEFMVSDGDRLVCYITITGTHEAPFMGIPATGKTFRVNGTDIFRFDDDGKVAEHWGVFDTFGMMMQLGVTPQPHPEPG